MALRAAAGQARGSMPTALSGVSTKGSRRLQ